MNEEQVTPVPDDELWNRVSSDRATLAADDVDIPQEQHAQSEASEADPLMGLPEPTRKLIADIQAKTAEQDERLRDAGQKLASAHGTIGNLTKKLDDSLRTLTQLRPALDAVEAQEKARTETAASEAEEKRRTLRENLEGTDIVEYIDMVMADVKPKIEVNKTVQQPVQQPVQQVEEPVDVESLKTRLTAERELSDLHPGWMALSKSDEFLNWRKSQPKEIGELAYSPKVEDADKMFTLFKQQKEGAAKIAQVEAERNSRLRRGEIVQGRGTQQQGESADPGDLWDKVTRDRAKASASA